MYGLLLENLSEYVKTVYGDDKWEEIRKSAGRFHASCYRRYLIISIYYLLLKGIASTSFGVHDDYDENLINHLAATAQQVIKL